MKTYRLVETNNKDLFRLMDRNNDWKIYFHKPSGKYLRAVNAILDEGYAKGQRFYDYLKNGSAEKIEKVLEAAGERGDRIHQAIYILAHSGKTDVTMTVKAEDNKTDVTLSNDQWECLLTWAEFWNRHNAKMITQEMSVFNLTQGYAGTYDAICILRKNCGVKTCPCDKFIGKTGLLDWKSSGGIYESYGPQVAAYAMANGIKVDYTGIVRIGTAHKTTGGYEFKPYDTIQIGIHFEEFMAALTISNATHKPFNPEIEIKDIPDKIILANDDIVEVPVIGTITGTGEITYKKPVAKKKIILKKKKIT